LARSSVNELRQQGGYLNVRQPERATAMPPTGQAMQADRLAGAWTGELTYYPSPAVLNATFRFEGHTCQGEVAIQIPDRRQRYEAPMTSCSLAEHSLTFSVVTLPLPFLIDRFTGRLVDDRLVGTVERTGRELTNSMHGLWSLRRQTARAHDEPKEIGVPVRVRSSAVMDRLDSAQDTAALNFGTRAHPGS
jgi:hypothetical protein